MFMTIAKRDVQTEIESSLYDFVVKTAKAKGITLKEATREALRRWASMEGDLSWDPLFDLSKTFNSKKATDSSKVDEILYGKGR